jgi:hypothetical protein
LPGGGGYEPLNPFDTTGQFSCPGSNWKYFSGMPNNPQVDRIPLEGILGWDTTLNGNLAELLQEPSLMGAYEGAAITVLARGVKYPAGENIFGQGSDSAAGGNIAHEGQFPVPTVELSSADCLVDGDNPYPSNFQCNPSRIDGLALTDSSQGGGGILVHGWGHHLEISNNRIYNNTGTLTGGITIGQGESPDSLLAGNGGDPVGLDQQPWTCLPGAVVTTNAGVQQVTNPPGTFNNQQLPYCYNTYVNVHNNSVTSNSSIGDELFSATPAGAGGVSFCTGSDYYKFNYNWICGNLSTGDGGGVSHLGFSYNGDIEHNSILFNQSTNPTIPTNGGGLIVMGAAPDGTPGTGSALTECGSITDVDCAPGLSDGTGPGMVINANLIMGNTAESGSGGGIRLQDVNGTEVGFFPLQPTRWNSVRITNNIVANNVAGWDGAGISLQDALVTNILHNTIMSNDTTASAGVLFNTLGAPEASAPGAGNQTASTTTSAPQPAGLVTMRNTTLLTGSVGAVICPAGHGSTLTQDCKNFSVPILDNNVFWQNRTFYIGVGSLGQGTLNQQNVVALYNSFTTNQAASQPTTDATSANGQGAIITGGTGACVPSSYWDIGVRGDTAPSNHSSGLKLTPSHSVITDAGDYTGNGNMGTDPTVISQYCNGSRTPPEFNSAGYQVPPGISDATVPNPIFNLQPAATVDEGNNWINMSWGPLTLVHPLSNTLLGNYALASGSPAIDQVGPLVLAVENAQLVLGGAQGIPTTDFFDHTRSGSYDIGAVEFQGAGATTPILASISPASHAPGGAAFTVTLTGSNLRGTGVNPPLPTIAVSGSGVTATANSVTILGTSVTATFTVAANAAPGDRTVTLTNNRGTSNPLTFTVAVVPTLASISPNTGTRGTAVDVTLTGTNLTGATSVNVSGTGSGAITAGTLTVSPDGTTLKTRLTIPSGATLNGHTVSVTTPAGTTGNVNFTVTNPAPPTLISVSPSSGQRGDAVQVTLFGTNFTAGSVINVTRTGGGTVGVTVSDIAVVDATTITATFTIATNANVSARNVSVTTPGGTTANRTFTITSVAPTLTSITPNAGPRGFDVDVQLVGTHFSLNGSSVTVSGTGVTSAPLIVAGPSNAETTLLIDPAAGLGSHTVRVVTPNGTSNGITFTVQGPTLSSISPTSGTAGTSVPVTLNGSLLMGATSVNISGGGGVTVSGLNSSANGIQVTATFNIAANASGTRNVSVTTPNGTTGNVTFTIVNPNTPTLSSVSPTSGARGTNVPITLTGTHFAAGATVAVSGTRVSAGSLHVVNATTITATLNIQSNAANTTRNITVTTTNGTSNSVPFKVN